MWKSGISRGRRALLLVFTLWAMNCVGQEPLEPQGPVSSAKLRSQKEKRRIEEGRTEKDGSDAKRAGQETEWLRTRGLTPSQRPSAERLEKASHPAPLRSIDPAKLVLLDLTGNYDTNEAVQKDERLAAISRHLVEHSQLGMRKLLAQNRGRIVIILGHNKRGRLLVTDSNNRSLGSPIDLRQLDADAQEAGAFPIIMSCFAACYVRAGPTRKINSLDAVRIVSAMTTSLVDHSYRLDGSVPAQSLFFPNEKPNLFRISPEYADQLLQQTTYVITDLSTGKVVLKIQVPSCFPDDGGCELIRHIAAAQAAKRGYLQNEREH